MGVFRNDGESVERSGEEMGEIKIRGNTVMKGYLKNEAHTFVYEWGWGVRQAGHGLWRARSRLYRSRFLRPNSHFAAFLEIYKIDIPSHRFALTF